MNYSSSVGTTGYYLSVVNILGLRRMGYWGLVEAPRGARVVGVRVLEPDRARSP